MISFINSYIQSHPIKPSFNSTQLPIDSLYESYLSKPTKQLPPTSKFALSVQYPCKIWLSDPKKPSEIKKKRQQKLKNCLKPNNFFTSNLEIYKHLVSLCENCEIFVKIPETVVIGFGFVSPVLLFNDSRGRIRALKDFSSMHMKVLIELFICLRKSNGDKLAPLAIKRDNSESSCKVLMKASEIALEWKNSYNVDAIIQRFIFGKGCKASKIVGICGKDLKDTKDVKIFKIINKTRNDFNTNEGGALMHRPSIFKPKIKSLQFFKQFLVIESKVNQTETKSPEILTEPSILRTTFPKSDNNSNAIRFELSLGKSNDKVLAIRKNFSTNLNPVNNFPKKFLNFKEYINSCTSIPPVRSEKEIVNDLINCKFQDTDLSIEGNEDFALRYFGSKLKELFLVSDSSSANVDVYEIKSEKTVKTCSNGMYELIKLLNSYVLSIEHKKISKFSCDFAQDSSKSIYFLSVKTIKTVKIEKPSKVINFSHIFTCPGKFCKLSQKKHIIKPEYSIMRKTLAEKSDFTLTGNINYLDRVKVCKECFDGYKETKNRSHSFGGLRLKTFEKNEIVQILEEINPHHSEETCKSLNKKLDSGLTAESTQVSENLLLRGKTISRKRARIKYFSDKFKEIIDNVNNFQ